MDGLGVGNMFPYFVIKMPDGFTFTTQSGVIMGLCIDAGGKLIGGAW